MDKPDIKKGVIVAGGSGFIGSHLCGFLLEKGAQVICIDNMLTGSVDNIRHLLKNKNFRFVEDDISKEITTDYSGVGYIFHLASPASPIDYWRYPEETLLVNSFGTLNLLRLANSLRAKFLMASTSETYGDPLEHPQKESYFGNVNTFGPRSCYDESKRFSEAAVRVFIDKYGLDARIIRIFNTYGPKMKKDDGRVVSNFIVAALLDKDLKIDGDGSQTRSFCYVDDLVEGIYKAMFTDNTNGQIINLGNPSEFTILELAEMVIDMTKSKSKIVLSNKFRENDPMKRKPDITKAKKILSWSPKTDLKKGLTNTISYFKTLV